MEDKNLYIHSFYPDYRFSKDGKIYTHFNSDSWREMKLSQQNKKKKYYKITLKDKNGIKKGRLVHRVIAELFIPNPENLPCINHKDENPQNNAIDNLEWCTYQYNNTYGHRFEKGMRGFLKASKERRVPIVATDGQGNNVFFESLVATAAFVERGTSTVGRHLKSGRPCNGYILRLAREKEVMA